MRRWRHTWPILCIVQRPFAYLHRLNSVSSTDRKRKQNIYVKIRRIIKDDFIWYLPQGFRLPLQMCNVASRNHELVPMLSVHKALIKKKKKKGGNFSFVLIENIWFVFEYDSLVPACKLARGFHHLQWTGR